MNSAHFFFKKKKNRAVCTYIEIISQLGKKASFIGLGPYLLS